MKKIAVVVLNFNGDKNTLECLQSLNSLSNSNELFVIVVDNGSKKEFNVPSEYKWKLKELKIIRSEKNLGFSGGNNRGVKLAIDCGADYIFILNNDTILEKESINELVKELDSDERIGAVVPKVYFAKGYEYHKTRYRKDELGKVIWYAGGVMDWSNVIGHHKGVDEIDRGQYGKTQQTDFATGCCIFLKRQIIERVGFFDERYFLYYEDNDLSQRIKRAGYKIIYVPNAVVWHKNAGSVGGSGSALQDYYITRNRLLFGMTYAPLKSKISLLKEAFKLLLFGRKWQKKGIRDFFMKKLGKGSYDL